MFFDEPPYDLDNADNGIALPASTAVRGESGQAIHNGSHKKWNELVDARLSEIARGLAPPDGKNLASVPPETLSREVYRLQEELRTQIVQPDVLDKNGRLK